MSISTDQGPITWIQPMLSGTEPRLLINGNEMGVEPRSFTASMTDEQGVVVDTASGEHVPHVVLESPDAPLTLARFDFGIEWLHVAEEVFFQALTLVALAKANLLVVALDAPVMDLWVGDGARTTHVLSRSTSYGTTGTPFAKRPARCFVITGTTKVELTPVSGSPSAGEFQIDPTADETSILLGVPPATGALTRLAYYPLLPCTQASYEHTMNSFNDWDVEVSFSDYIRVRNR